MTRREPRKYQERRWGRPVVVLVAVVLAGGAGMPALPALPAPLLPTVVAEQQAVVSADHQPAVDAALGSITSDGSALDAARRLQAGDQALAARAVTMAEEIAAAVHRDTAQRHRDVGARDAATAAISDDVGRLRVIGVQLYTGPVVTPPGVTDDLARQQAEAFATDVVDIGAGDLIADLHRRRSDQRAATHAVGGDDRRLGRDRADLARAVTLRDDRALLLGRDGREVMTDIASLAYARSALAGAQAAQAEAVAALAGPPGVPSDGSPSIEGTAALDVAQIVGWYDAGGWGDLTATPIDQLVEWYLREGRAEGVRGDVAFAQAMVETAGFSSNDAVALNNYAGIGHCDSCSAGLAFGSSLLGVRGQIQLLHSFADGSLTAGTLAAPLAATSLAPQTQPDRGCCGTWQSLTGKWATDPLYGHTVMSVYSSMLGYALAQRSP